MLAIRMFSAVLILAGAIASPRPLRQTPVAVCTNGSDGVEAEVIGFHPTGELGPIECRWTTSGDLEVVDLEQRSPDLLIRSRELGAAVVEGTLWRAGERSLVVARGQLAITDLPVKVWIPKTDSIAAMEEVTDELANADYLLAANRTGVRLDEHMAVVDDEDQARKVIGEKCGENIDLHKKWASEDRLNIYYGWGNYNARCDPSELGFRAAYVRRGDRLGTILHEILHDAGLSNHIEAVGYCEWDPLGCGSNLLGDDLQGYFRDRLTLAQIFWMYRESDSILVLLLNREISGTMVSGRSCEDAQDRLPYLGPWVSEFCASSGHLKGIMPTSALILSRLRCDNLTLNQNSLPRTLAERGADEFRDGFIAAVQAMVAVGTEKERLAARYQEIAKSAHELETIRPASSANDFQQRYDGCDWIERMNILLSKFPFLLDDAKVRSLVKAVSH